MIVIEGCDNTGKTTLIEQLMKEFPELICVKSCGPGERLTQWIWQELPLNLNSKNRIYDRFFFSEFVYGPLLRGKICYSRGTEETVLEALRSIKPLVILCERYSGDVIGTFGERKQMEGVEERLPEIQQGYEKIVQPMLLKNKLNYVLYDFKIPYAFTQITKLVEQHLGGRG